MQYPDRRVFKLLLLLLDLVVLVAAFQLAVETRIALNRFYGFQMTHEVVERLVPPLGLILLLWIPSSAWLELYKPRRGAVMGSLLQVFECVAALSVLTIVVIFFFRDFGEGSSRTFVVFFAGWSLALLVLDRAALRGALAVCQWMGYAQERVAIAGGGVDAKRLAEHIESSRPLGIELCGVISTAAEPAAGVLGNPVPVLGPVGDAAALINAHRLDRIIAVVAEMDRMQVQSLAAICTRMGVTLNRLPAHAEVQAARLKVHEIAGLSLFELRGIQFTPGQERIKAVFDLVLGSVLLVVLSPLMLALALLVKATSRGPVFYVAPRVGKGGRHFPFYKFRSMVADAEARKREVASLNEKSGHLFKIRRDPRLTAVGRFMRRYSLDELPQVLNVLRREMSLVGPRPLPACDLDPDGLSKEHAFWAQERTRVLPGITGRWQVRGRSDLGFDDMIRHDLAYARSWSVWQDLMILVQTVPAVLRGRGAC
ncbi:MAG TPA: sugar transferase [Candidatus Polarisedimenticolia bacterium]|nr:sugar transferase [Candidatus Polarisedimenticolia bacterium]